ncbi:MAG TPA: nucleotidyltransferase domain-containing protein [Candidatus Acidoferrum sp.]|nr:nucleotidyltransferase domain-containing protein [Candidatus Acidoferrum sp.]
MILVTEQIDRICALDILRKKLGCEWPSIETSLKATEQTKERLAIILLGNERRLLSEDANFTAFGSLARGEWTTGSDLDWTYLIDGESNPEHLPIAQRITELLEEAGFCKPGPTETFGNMAFSHEIIHQIGGQNDTNRNMTQRILLLLESIPIANRSAYNRVIAGILYRYLQEDTSFITSYGKETKIPRFLLNDIVRFWRTMAVDFASKQRERAGDGWALRNLKLRMSRKLIFVSGLLTCFSCLHDSSATIRGLTFDKGEVIENLVNHLKRYVNSTPLEIVARSIDIYGASDATAEKLFTSYDAFLQKLNDPEVREHLKRLKSDGAAASPVFQGMRQISHVFQDALTELFFGSTKLFELVKHYGVF